MRLGNMQRHPIEAQDLGKGGATSPSPHPALFPAAPPVEDGSGDLDAMRTITQVSFPV